MTLMRSARNVAQAGLSSLEVLSCSGWPVVAEWVGWTCLSCRGNTECFSVIRGSVGEGEGTSACA